MSEQTVSERPPWLLLFTDFLRAPTTSLRLPAKNRLVPESFKRFLFRQPDGKFFANRVSDRAANSVGRLKVSFGSHTLRIERKLNTLELVSITLDGQTLPSQEESYQGTVVKLVNLGSFSDFILMLRFIVFYFEDRRALVWDPTAQRQILRMLFLPPESARTWTEKERAILETDSHMRNLRAALTREQQSLTSAENTGSKRGGSAG